MSQKILQATIEAIQTVTGKKATWKQARTRPDLGFDGYVRLAIAKHAIEIPAVIKNSVLTAHLAGFHHLKAALGSLIVLTNHISPKDQEQLKKLGIFFIDAAGNAFIQQNGIYILIQGKKNETRAVPDTRAFTKGGIKVIFQLLLDDQLINLPIRHIAAAADVSLDTVHKTISALKTMRYLIPFNKDTMIWHNKKDLLIRWITEYHIRLKPALFVGRFDFMHEDFDQWKQLKFKNELTCWGGEPAGDLLTNNLKPVELTLYSPETDMQLTRNYRIIPREAGSITVYRRFWPQRVDEKSYAPPVLVYADLVNSGDRRNIEISKKVFDEYLQNQFQTA